MDAHWSAKRNCPNCGREFPFKAMAAYGAHLKECTKKPAPKRNR